MFEIILKALDDEIEKYPSEAALARDLGIPQKTLNDIRSGKVGIGSKTLNRILLARPGWLSLLTINNQ